MKVIWELRYARTVMAFLYSLRGSDTGLAMHDAIKALQFEDEPTKDREQLQERAGRYQFNVSGHQIRFEIAHEERKVIRILSIRQATAD